MAQDRYGSPDVLTLSDADTPVPAAEEVLVRVRAAALNPADYFMLTGVPYFLRLGSGLRRPRSRVRGTDLAGTVEAVGAGVTGFRPGDEVYGEGRGSLAEFTVAHQDRLATKPANLSFEQAAAVPMAACTALQLLRDVAKVTPGQQVLINGAAGGIGTFAVQIAKSLGAGVTGVCSTRNVELVRSLGADHVIDYTREDFVRSGQRYDVLLDNAGNRSPSDCRAVLTRTGTYLPNNGTSGGRWFGTLGKLGRAIVTSWFVPQRTRIFVSTAKREDLLALAELLDAGKLAPVIGRTYQWEEAAEALRHVGAGHAQGKVVVTV